MFDKTSPDLSSRMVYTNACKARRISQHIALNTLYMSRIWRSRLKITGMMYVTITCFIMLLLVMPMVSIPAAHGFKPATWSHDKPALKIPRMLASSLVYYDLVSPNDCASYATTAVKCYGTDAIYGTFSYATPKSYGIQGSCDYPCESQDVYVSYPSTFIHNGVVYYFNNAQQDQCAQDFGCSTETTWTSTGPVDVPYSGTPVGIPVVIDTQLFYVDSSSGNTLEIEFTYNLDGGYSFG